MDERSAIGGGMSERGAYHHGNLKEALVEAALVLVEQHGVTGLSLRGVAREAGVSQAAPYHHFPNKECLLAEVARRGFERLGVMLEEGRASHERPEEQMRACGRAYIAFALEQPAVYRLMFGPEICNKDDHPDLRATSVCTLGMLIGMLAEGQQRGVFGGSDPIAASIGVWSAVHGLASLLLDRLPDRKEIQGMEITQERMIAGTVDLLLDGLRPR